MHAAKAKGEFQPRGLSMGCTSMRRHASQPSLGAVHLLAGFRLTWSTLPGL
jgi:hypothetical protein